MVSLTHVHYGPSWSVWLMSIMVHHGQSDSCPLWSIMVSLTHVHHGQSDSCPSWSVWLMSTMVHHGQSDSCLSWSVWRMSIMVSLTHVHYGPSWSVWLMTIKVHHGQSDSWPLRSIMVSLTCVHLPSYLLSAPDYNDYHRIYATALTMGENNLITWLFTMGINIT